jgi:hypothetical protein
MWPLFWTPGSRTKRIKRRLSKVYYGPSDWLVAHTTARGRRSFGFWTLTIAIIGTLVLIVFGLGSYVWFLWIAFLSVVALIPNVTAETPVEEEGGD